MNENNTEKQGKDPVALHHWRAWGSWHSWGSPVGIGLGWFLFIVGFGLFLFLISGGGGVNVID
jgi:hypothetical protein